MTDIAARIQSALQERYAIERELGAGGMATVFLADDLKHKRKVALKVLRPELAAVIGAERFLAEIETTANLQHPHILPLFDSGEVDGTVFYVMPYVEGESLRDRLDREKQLPIDDAVRLTSEVASALDYAHRHDVIHRDIKPENILLHEGQAMVADFGIALAATGAGATRMTETGMSLGTPHYMSPEQAMGEREITARSDVYALGVILYEMLVGEPPFNGPTAQAIVAQVVTESPRALAARRGTIPEHVEAAVLTALEKLPADRFASAAEFRAALADTAFRRRGVPTQASVESRGGPWRPAALALGSLSIVLALVAGWALTGRPPATASIPPSFHHVRIWTWLSTPGLLARDIGLAPDGSAMVYVDSAGGSINLWLKEHSERDPVLLAGTEGGQAPFFSPDGRWIAFSAAGRLLKVPRRGGSAATVSDSGGAPLPGVWLDDGTVLFANPDLNLLLRVKDTGEHHERLLNAEGHNLFISRIAGIPGQRAILLSGCPNLPCAQGDVYLFDIETGDLRPLVEQATGAWHVAPDILVYSRLDGGVFASPFDVSTLTTHGAAVPVLDGVQTGDGQTDLVVGNDGTVVYVAGRSNTAAAQSQPIWIDQDGGWTPVDPDWRGQFVVNGGPAVSPDGTRLAISMVDSVTSQGHLFIKHLPEGPLTRLTFEGSQNFRPSWSPDGREVLFVSNRAGGKQEVWRQQASGGRQAVRVVAEERPVFEGLLTPDGEWLLFRTDDLAAGRGDIYARRVAGDTTTVPLVATPAEETSPTVSHDGRWLAYASSETGRKEIYVRPFPNTDAGLWQVSTGGGVEPIWSRDGSELFYRTLAGDVFVAEVETETEFHVRERRMLFRIPDASANDDNRFWDVRGDGQSFLMFVPVQAGTEQSRSDVVLIENWFTAVREAVAEANE